MTPRWSLFSSILPLMQIQYANQLHFPSKHLWLFSFIDIFTEIIIIIVIKRIYCEVISPICCTCGCDVIGVTGRGFLKGFFVLLSEYRTLIRLSCCVHAASHATFQTTYLKNKKTRNKKKKFKLNIWIEITI